jgi:hypothetical protein
MTFAAINETSKQSRNRTPNLLKNGLHFLVAHENELPSVTRHSPTLQNCSHYGQSPESPD